MGLNVHPKHLRGKNRLFLLFSVLSNLLLTGVQEKLGVMNKGVVYALWDYEAQNNDELSFHEGDAITILRRKDDNETEWWWARLNDKEGYVPKNLLGVSSKILSPLSLFIFFNFENRTTRWICGQTPSVHHLNAPLLSSAKQSILILFGLYY